MTAIVIGCGNRGQTYSNFAKELPTWLKIVAVADPQKHRREKVARMANLTNPDMILDDWTKLAKLDKLADCAFITTQDQMHMEPAVILAKKGYHLLLEKPMSVDESECEKIAQACQDSGVILAVCHVLRYFGLTVIASSMSAITLTPYYSVVASNSHSSNQTSAIP